MSCSASHVPQTSTSKSLDQTADIISTKLRSAIAKPSVTEPSRPGLSRAPSRQEHIHSSIAPRRPESVAEDRTQSKNMPPPAVVPRRDGPLRVQDLELVDPSSSSNLSRPRAGPIRPEALVSNNFVSSAASHGNPSEQKRATSGARRVLRPEPSVSETERPQAKSKEPALARRVGPPDALVRQRSLSNIGRQPTGKPATASGSSRIAEKQLPAKVDGCSHEVPKRLNKPATTQQQAARQRALSSKPVTRTGLNGKPQGLQATKLSSKPTSGSHSRREAGFVRPAGKSTRMISPAEVPLPPSRPHTPPSRPNTPPASPAHSSSLHNPPSASEHAQPPSAPEDKTVDLDDDPTPSRPATLNIAIEPATPIAQTGQHRRMVEQTPISALVESIQKGFMFTPASGPLFSVEEGDSNEHSLEVEMFPKVEPLTRECKPLVLTKPSS
jgi:hypothetical protein